MTKHIQVRKQTFKGEDKGTYIYLLIDLHENKREKKDKLTSLYIIMWCDTGGLRRSSGVNTDAVVCIVI